MADTDAIPLKEHLLALREADLRRMDDLRKADQRALQIKEEGDRRALELARDIQTYKDEKANELREQISNERGTYVTKDQASAQFKGLATAIAAIAALMGIFVWLSRGIG